MSGDEEDFTKQTERPTHLKQMMQATAKQTAAAVAPKDVVFKYTISVRLTFPQITATGCDTADEIRSFVAKVAASSLFRSHVLGIFRKKDPSTIIPLDKLDALPPGKYIAKFFTEMPVDELEDIVFTALNKLNAQRPHKKDQLLKLDQELLLSKFTHASLTQEGSTITLWETVLLSNLLAKVDPLHQFDDGEMSKLVIKTESSEREVVEAVNHLQVSRRVSDFVLGGPLSEEGLLDMHKQLMERLLTNPAEGLAGEYRKVAIGIHNSTTCLAPTAEVPEKMKAFFVTLTHGARNEEPFHEFLSRVHTEFERIHPFRDGNGRIGRLIINILALKKGYTVIFFLPEQRTLFSKACESAAAGSRTLMDRMILEAFYASLRLYEVVPGIF